MIVDNLPEVTYLEYYISMRNVVRAADKYVVVQFEEDLEDWLIFDGERYYVPLMKLPMAPGEEAHYACLANGYVSAPILPEEILKLSQDETIYVNYCSSEHCAYPSLMFFEEDE